MAQNRWSHDEMVLALALYFQIPFGKINRNTPEIKKLGNLIGRGANAASMRLANYAHIDPYIINSGRNGLAGGASVCQGVWDEYVNDKERLYKDAAEIKARLMNQTLEESLQIQPTDFVGYVRETVIKQRVDQSAFRIMILNNYNETCAITGINDKRLLSACHIIPWSKREDTRLNPENGICLSPLYHEAFDQGLFTIRPDDYTVKISPSLKDSLTKDVYQEQFGKYENRKIRLPEEHLPDEVFLQHHADNIFIA